MNRKLIYLPVILITIFFSNCSKKNFVSNNNEMYKKYSYQLESDYPAVTKAPDAALSASANAKEIEIPAYKNENLVTPLETKEIKKERETNYKRMEKLYNNKLINRIVTKNVEKAVKRSSQANGLNSNVRTGIIVGAVGLILLVIASAFTGAAFNIFLLLGAVLFIIGIVLILLGVL